MNKTPIIIAIATFFITSCGVNRAALSVSRDEVDTSSVESTHRTSLASLDPIFNINYSSEISKIDNALSLDVYPARGTNLPVVIFVHGGGWFRGDKSNVDFKPAAFNTKGFIFISVNYRLIPEVDVTQQMHDIASSISWVSKNIMKYGGNPSNIFLLGHSAGAHLVSLIGTDESYLKSEGVSTRTIRGIVSLDTQTYDLDKLLSNLDEKNGGEVYWETFGHDPEFWKQMSPIMYISPDKYIPPFFIVFTGERKSRAIQSTIFGNALEDANVPTILYSAIDKTHGQLNRELGLPNDEVTQAIFYWLDNLIH